MYEEAHGFPQTRSTCEFINGNLLIPESQDQDRPIASWVFREEQIKSLEFDDNFVPGAEGNKNNTIRSEVSTCEMVRECQEDLLYRVATLERQVSAQTECDHLVIIKDRVKAVRVGIKVDILSLLSRPLRKPVKIVRSMSGAVVETVVSKTYECDFTMFNYMVTDLLATVQSGKRRDDVRLEPSGFDIYHMGSVSDASIIFRTASAFFKWIGVHGSSQLKRLLLKTQETSGCTSIRLLGGMQYNPDDSTQPLSIYPGGSCARVPDAFEGDKMLALHWQDSSYDLECGLHGNSELLEVATGFNTTDRKDMDCFFVNWKARMGNVKVKCGSGNMDLEGVRLGTMTVSLPAILFHSLDVVRDVMDHMNNGRNQVRITSQ